MKKLIALILVLCMTFSLSSCISDNDLEVQTDESAEIENVSDEVIEEDDFEVAMFWFDLDAYGSDLKALLDKKLPESNLIATHYNVETPSCDIYNQNESVKYCQEKQIKQVDEAIANGADVLFVQLRNFTDDYYYSLCDKAESAGIPIVFLYGAYLTDRYLNYHDNIYDVESIFGREGVTQGEMVGEYILDNYDFVDRNKDGYISYVLVKGELGCPDCEKHAGESIEYCNNVLIDAGMPEMKFYDPKNSDQFLPNGNSMSAYMTFREALTNDPIGSENAMEIIIARYDDSAIACIEVLNEFGFNTGEGDFIPVFGTGGYELDAIEEGKLTGSVCESITGKADIITRMLLNAKDDKDLFDGLYEDYEIDANVNRIYVPFDKLMKQ